MKEKKSSKIGQVITIIVCVILIIFVIMNSVLIFKSYTDPDNIPSVFGLSPVIVLSGSMSPTFDTNAIIFIKEVDTSTLEVGDVICYITSGTAITHRIYDIIEENGTVRYTTKGDANNVTDTLSVYPEQVQGVYIGHIAGIGALAMFMQTTTGMVVFIAIPVALYILFDILKRKKESQKEKIKTAQLEAELAKYRSENPPQE